MGWSLVHWQQHGKTCPYCGVEMIVRKGAWKDRRFATRDHLFPRSRFAVVPAPINVTFVCQGCNADKGSLTPEEWLLALELDNDSRQQIFHAFYKDWLSIHPEAKIITRAGDLE